MFDTLLSVDPPKVRVAVIAGLAGSIADQQPSDFRSTMQHRIERVIGVFGSGYDVVFLGMWESQQDDGRLCGMVQDSHSDVLLVIPTMACPAAGFCKRLASFGIPIVIANATFADEIPEEMSNTLLFESSSNVGAMMIRSALNLAHDDRAICISGHIDDRRFAQRLQQASTVAHASFKSLGMRIGKFGTHPIGYDHVDFRYSRPPTTTFEIIEISQDEMRDTHQSISDREVHEFASRCVPDLLPANTIFQHGEHIVRSSKLFLTLWKLSERYSLDCGAINCRGEFGTGLKFGAVSGLASSLLGRLGKPFAPTGDVLTAIAMWFCKKLTGTAFFCEPVSIDHRTNSIFLSNTGEADFNWGSAGEIRIHDANHELGYPLKGAIVEQRLNSEKCTMLGVTRANSDTRGFALIATEGSSALNKTTRLVTGHTWYRPQGNDAHKTFETWVNSGVPHHASLCDGHLGEAMNWLSKLSGIRTELV